MTSGALKSAGRLLGVMLQGGSRDVETHLLAYSFLAVFQIVLTIGR